MDKPFSKLIFKFTGVSHPAEEKWTTTYWKIHFTGILLNRLGLFAIVNQLSPIT
jgi:hypothetical protein